MVLDSAVKVIIFDFDGTLFHLSIDWKALKRNLGIEQGDKSIGELVQEYALSQHPDLQKVTDAELRAVGDGRVSEENIAILQRLDEDYQVAVVTRNSRYAVEQAFKGTALEDRIYIVGREDEPHLKPDPAGVHKVLDTFGVSAQETVLVGDTYHDVEAARAAGVASMIVRNSQLAYRPEGAGRYIENLNQLL